MATSLSMGSYRQLYLMDFWHKQAPAISPGWSAICKMYKFRNKTEKLITVANTPLAIKRCQFIPWPLFLWPSLPMVLLQPLICGTVFHRTSLLPLSLSPSSSIILNHISSHFLIRCFLTLLSFVQCPHSDSSFWTLY